MRQNVKLYAMAVLLGGGLCVFGYRLVDLQVVHHDEFLTLAQQNTVRTIERQPVRGQILDIHGTPLAYSQPAKLICADPTIISNQYLRVAHFLAPLLQTNEAWLAEKLAPRDGKTNYAKYVALKHKVPLETWEKIHEALAGLTFGIDEKPLNWRKKEFYNNIRSKAIYADDDQIRVYPGQHLASHVVGFVAADDQSGLSGIECSYNSKLAGVAGWRKTEMDNKHREIVRLRDQDVPACDGLNVVLNLDAGLQNIVESELAKGLERSSPISISCVMVRPRTGEILAMACLPDFDPNRPGAFPMDDLRNRIIADVAEPGSTFKIVVVTAGLDRGMRLTDMFNCEMGRFFYAGHWLHDHAPYGMLSIENIITKSSNIGAAKIGIELGKTNLSEYIHDFGFGERTGIQLPGEQAGIVHSITNVNWTAVSIAQIPMGQGIAVTSLQTVMAMSAIANNGILMRPMLVNRLEEPGGKVVVQYTPQPFRRVATPDTIHKMVEALKTVPTKEGTAVAAHLDHYTVAGKTGTAQKVEHGKYVQRFYSSFIGFFPADNPELCIAVIMDDPKDKDKDGHYVGHFGGVVAGPVFHAIAERAANYLSIKPDVAPELAMPQNMTVASVATHR